MGPGRGTQGGVGVDGGPPYPGLMFSTYKAKDHTSLHRNGVLAFLHHTTVILI